MGEQNQFLFLVLILPNQFFQNKPFDLVVVLCQVSERISHHDPSSNTFSLELAQGFSLGPIHDSLESQKPFQLFLIEWPRFQLLKSRLRLVLPLGSEEVDQFIESYSLVQVSLVFLLLTPFGKVLQCMKIVSRQVISIP